jgi:ATP-dependent Lon protease
MLSRKKYPQAETFHLPVIPLRGIVPFPGMMLPLLVGRPSTLAALEEAQQHDRMVLMVAQRDEETEDPTPEDLYDYGVLAEVVQYIKLPDGNVRVMADCSRRCQVKGYSSTSPGYIKSTFIVIEEEESHLDESSEALTRYLKNHFEQVVSLSQKIPPEVMHNIGEENYPGPLADYIASYLDIKTEERQKILETLEPLPRAMEVAELLTRELQLLEVDKELDAEVREGMNENQREYFLRERLKAIQDKLGEQDSSFKEADQLRARAEEAGMSEEALQKAKSEISRLEKMPPIAPEVGIIRTYVELLCDLPWQKRTEDHYDLKLAQDVLDEDHYALEKIKDRILEYLAVRKLNPNSRGPILCFAGPPGVGKTSIGKSIAKALGREFIRVSVGGIHDEAEIRGHRRTYIGSMPGRIIAALRRAKVKNPVFMLDEIDKLGQDFRGDPSSALLEALDPEQNNAFSDHYLEVPFDLSEVMFIATANLLNTIPAALKDRFEILRFPGYTEQEKLNIARKFLIPKQTSENGLLPKHLTFTDNGTMALIQQYTREAGVRNLEREVGSVCRKVARQVATESWKKKVSVTPKSLHEFLGPQKFTHDLAQSKDEIGVAQGMAYTEFGGEVMPVEVSLVGGKGNAKLTGNLGNVMKESCEAAMTYIRSHLADLKLDKDWAETQDAHIHVPAGAVPKDGPSAGVAISVALASALTGRAVRKEFAMTGEISLRGKVLPIGGVKEKVLAAHRAGITEIILPKENERDLEDLTKEVRDSLQFHLVETLDQALKLALLGK